MIDLTGYKLTFDDEFNSRSISLNGQNTVWADTRAEWKHDAFSDVGFGNSSFVDPASGYDPFDVSNGVLTITAVPDQTIYGNAGSWESGLITTQASFAQKYGYFEMRADLCGSVGAWDAFWLMPVEQQKTGNPGWQELDIVEHYGVYDKGVYSWIHTTDFHANPGLDLQVFSNHPEITQGYHTYGMDWTEDKISFYVDGVLMGWRPTPSDMHSEMYLIANLATQSTANQHMSPMSMSIDYIRVYSSDPHATAVELDTVSAPDGNDPGLYGATAATAAKAAREIISGTSYGELVKGTTGKDVIDAGGGNDKIHGMAGGDKMKGGNGRDMFIFKSLDDTSATSHDRDRILDFSGRDQINLRRIDANELMAGSQQFDFIGEERFHGHAGELRYVERHSNTYLIADVDGDKHSDFSIRLDGHVALTEHMFVL